MQSPVDILALEALITKKFNQVPGCSSPKVGETWRVQFPGDIEFTRILQVEFLGILNVVLSGKTMRNNQVLFIERMDDERE